MAKSGLRQGGRRVCVSCYEYFFYVLKDEQDHCFTCILLDHPNVYMKDILANIVRRLDATIITKT